MTEQEHNELVRAWLDEEGDRPTPFGEAVFHVLDNCGISEPELLDLKPDHQAALADHCDGVEGAETPWDLPSAVARAIGLDLDATSGEDLADLNVLARAWTFGGRPC